MISVTVPAGFVLVPEEVLAPFIEAAKVVPIDRPDGNIVAVVPGGHNSIAFREMSEKMTAGAFRELLKTVGDEA